MSKLLEKALKDAVKEKKCTLGAKEVLGSLKDSKLIIVSQSVQKKFSFKIDVMFASVIDVIDIVETRNCNPHNLPKATEDPLN